MNNGAAERSPNLSPDKVLREGAGKNVSLSRNGNFERPPHLIETARALRHFVRGKPQAVRDAARNIIAGFRAVLAGRGEPATYRMLGENVERLGGG